MNEFVDFPKIARLDRDVVVTEKIDGTNAQIVITDEGQMFVGSRTRYISTAEDNHGFARWAVEHADELLALGAGRHYGEWWGSGIQRGYGLPKGEKRFSLFNVSRWADDRDRQKYPQNRPACCHVVPVLYVGTFDSFAGHKPDILDRLAAFGSQAAPGFMDPEGIVMFHVAAGVYFKKTLKKDDEYKGAGR